MASAKAVNAGRATSRPIAFADAPSRRRKTGRNVDEARTTPMKRESHWTRCQLAA
jgi:hypothetical protein